MALIIKSYVSAFLVFFAIDMLWLGLIAKNFYGAKLGHLMTPKVLWTPAFIFYMLFVAGILFFVVFPALQKGSWTYALGAGALFGLITYATYDLTNLATLKDWPLVVTLVDLVWGSVLSASTATLSFLIINKFF
ncbi:MAG TPA: DUF2177 family protein [Caldisericia bacterium]|jgi:uncharacterized membrane protein|nr:DUF2177 family protein [Caldisericia bacterium]